jgi:hypothetical protein
MEDFVHWVLNMRMDAVSGIWFENNKYTLAVIVGLPALVARWWWVNKAKIMEIRKEFKAKIDPPPPEV